LGAEASSISQTGDAEQERSFSYLKPQGILTWSPGRGAQTWFRVAREVSQLVLTDFISATLFEDNDLALGNPDIQPETTWVAELTQERRFGSNSVIRLRAFHHWISNVLDLLPLTPTFEVPGNIGEGRRWGLELEATVPLARFGLTGARMDIKTRWQDSTVADPVTDLNRVLSSPGGDFPFSYDVENKWGLSLDYRQDFEVSRIAWGWTLISRAERPVFKVNELEVNDETVDLIPFIETTRWLGIKIRLSALNVLNAPSTRYRTVFTGERDLSPLKFSESRTRTRDRSATLTISGVF
jgi:outer membrane receptor protein involved in Fe transport